MLRTVIALPRCGTCFLLAFLASTSGLSALSQEPPAYEPPAVEPTTSAPQMHTRPWLTPPTYIPPGIELTYEPPADPIARIAMSRASRAQLVRIRHLAREYRVNLPHVVQAYYHKERIEDLSLSQAADLIVHLQRRPSAYIYSYPHTRRDMSAARQDWGYNRAIWPLVWMFRL